MHMILMAETGTRFARLKCIKLRYVFNRDKINDQEFAYLEITNYVQTLRKFWKLGAISKRLLLSW